MKYFLLGMLWGMMCLSCTPTYKGVEFLQSENVTIHLLGDSSIIGTPMEIIKYHDLILTSDFQGDSLMWVFDVSKNEMIKKWVSKGQGPDEFLSPIHMALIDSVLIIQGRSQFIFQKYQPNLSSLTLEKIAPLIHIPAGIDILHPVNAGMYIASGVFVEGRYAIVNHEGEIVQYFGNYPNYIDGENRIPNLPKFMFHQPVFTYNSHREKLASVAEHVLEIINFSENQPIVEKQILLSPYNYNVSEGRTRSADNNQFGALYTCSTNDYIYIVYNTNIVNDRSESEVKRENPQIWIFDWDGNPVKKILPDLWVKCIYVENDNKTVYCIVYSPEPTLASFTINL